MAPKEFSRSSTDSQETAVSKDEDVPGYTYQDKLDMERMGKPQELLRNFRTLSSIAFTSCCMGTWEILLTVSTPGLIAGGSAGLFWSLIWVYIGQAFVVLSLAEMASMAPSAGGQYHWVSEFAPKSCQKVLSYMSGWLSTLAWQSSVAVDAFLIGRIVLGLCVINDRTFEPKSWHATLLIIATVIGLAAFNILAGKRLALTEIIFVSLHFLAFIPVVATLWAMTGRKQSADVVFTQFTDNGAGWPSIGLSVMVGQVSNVFVVLGSASSAQMSEEIADAGLAVPKSMIWSFVLNIPMAFGILITYLFCLDNISEAISSPSGYPFIYVFHKATGTPAGATGLTVVILVLLLIITSSAYTGTSRQLYAFARDNGMPGSKWLAKVHPAYKVPVNSILATALFTILLSFINIGSTVAFDAVLSLASVAIMATYGISVGCVLVRRFRKQPFPPARWSLGRTGIFINVAAMVYIVEAFFWCFWPNTYEPSPGRFNWAVVLFLGVMAVAGLEYWLRGKDRYRAPVSLVKPMA